MLICICNSHPYSYIPYIGPLYMYTYCTYTELWCMVSTHNYMTVIKWEHSLVFTMCVQALRVLCKRLASKLSINYFDSHNHSKHRILLPCVMCICTRVQCNKRCHGTYARVTYIMLIIRIKSWCIKF